MDEPLSNLDAKLREEARAWLRELILKMRLSALVVTHDQNEAMAMSDRILLLNNGVIEQEGTPQELYGQPRTLFVADFMGSNNRVEGRIVERRGDAALIAGDGWQLWGDARGQRRRGRAGDGHGPPRARPPRRAARAPTPSSCRWSPRCSWATAGSTCSIAATCACAPTGRAPSPRASSGSRSRRRASGSSEPRRSRQAAARDAERGMDKHRLDKWLWAARFYKTRALAAEDIAKGRVSVNEQVAKASRELHEGDVIELPRPDRAATLVVLALSRQRGPAPIAQALYEETPESIERRLARAAGAQAPAGAGAGHRAGPADQARPSPARRLEPLERLGGTRLKSSGRLRISS